MTDSFQRAIPPSLTPRPGEDVVYYRGEIKYSGTFHGYDIYDQPIVKNSESGSTVPLNDVFSVRPANPGERLAGCYTRCSSQTVIQQASSEEKHKLDLLLNKHIEPGPKYIDLIEEIWQRGYEVFLVGGSVRDVLNGDQANDVDLVSTIPFYILSSIAEAMFGPGGWSRHEKNGFMSIGRNAGVRKARKGTLIDVKNFFLQAPGTNDAQFGADLDYDHRLRDFSCNAVYYDPLNAVYVDPCGHGIEDAKKKILNVVNDPSLSHPVNRKAHIAMRMFKFMHRTYSPTEDCINTIREIYQPMMDGCKPDEIWNLFYRSILGKVPKEERGALFWESKTLIFETGFGEIWDTFIQHKEDEFGGGS
ncbi:hypothetical protein [Ruegeria sp. YS9]|uniref:hypothetical protein n=1 Tax=Ruegeria sp. YS9 TaxID=2966453 RepID=UPI00214A9A24|nr:hypothetical protein [Ruegeria sp. YS9]UUV06538.1 hypothetical protein NOR97_01950 [Ruegeria sp. YS9]